MSIIGKSKLFSQQNLRSYSSGFTVLELIISMTIGTVLIAGAMSVFISNTKASNNVLESSRLNHEMRTIMEIMSNDIRKAGYWAGAKDATPSTPNPFGHTTVSNTGKCILYTYDANDNSAVDNPDEEFGFRINSDNIESRLNGSDCTATNAWNPISDNSSVEITDLSFSSNYQCTNVSDSPVSNCTSGALDYTAPNTNDVLIEAHKINILLSGRLKNNTDLTLTINDSIHIKNDSVKLAL